MSMPGIEAYHLEALRRQRSAERRRSEQDATAKKVATAGEAVGMRTRTMSADGYHRAALTNFTAKLTHRYSSTEYFMQW